MLNSNSTVLVSRTLKADSPIINILKDRVQEILDIPFVTFRKVEFEVPQGIQGLFFYSPRSAEYFFQNLKDPKAYAENLLVGAMGPGTAKVVNSFGVNVDLIGQGTPYDIANDFVGLAAGKNILFPVAKNSLHSLEEYVRHDLEYTSCVVYDNQPKQLARLPKADILVFTSPLSIKGYLASGGVLSGKQIVAIGPTTGAFLKTLGPFSFKTAAKPTEEAMAHSILSYLN